MATVNSTSNSNTNSNTIQNGRYWGLATGLDIDSIVDAMLTKQQSKIYKAQQQQQKLEWKQEAYRDIITKLRDFEKAYLMLGSSTSMATTSMYTSYNCTSSNPYLTVSANSDASGSMQTVEVKQSATVATLTGGTISSDVTSSYTVDVLLQNLKDLAAAASSFGTADPSITVTVDGVSKTISFSGEELNGLSASGFADLVNTKLSAAFGQVTAADGSGTVTKISASVDTTTNKLVFSANGGYQTQFSLTASTSSFDVRMLGAITSIAERNGKDAPTITVSYGGESKTLSFSTSDDLSESGYLATIQSKLDAEFAGKGLTASVDANGKLTIKDADGKEATISTANTNVTALDAIGFTNGANNRLNVNTTTLGDFLSSKNIEPTVDENGKIYATINNVKIELGTKDTKLSEVFANINKSAAGVTIAYNKTLDTVSLTANQSGAAGTVDISGDQSGLFTALGFTKTSDTGRDAIITINGVSYTRDSNNFVIDGVTYGINIDVDPAKEGYQPLTSTVTFTKNTDTLKKGIQDFIAAYNSLIDAINTQIKTAPDKDYPPLTEAQKAQMTQEQIDRWNEKAKQGMLFNDDTLESLLEQMREILYQSVTLDDGSTYSLYEMGITTSNSVDDYGKLEIKTEDEEIFEEAIAKHADKIKQLFTKSSSIPLDINPQTPEQVQNQKIRKQEEGLVARLDDIIKSYAGSVSGNKGSLLIIAGITGDSTQYNNNIYNQIKEINETINKLKDQLKTQRERYYDQFEALEAFVQQANAQSSMLLSLLRS